MANKVGMEIVETFLLFSRSSQPERNCPLLYDLTGLCSPVVQILIVHALRDWGLFST